MIDKKPNSLDIWDYLTEDMPYMPSRGDRDQLLKLGEENRVRIWDYFFRIDPNDVGKPHKYEMADIDKRLSEKILQHNQSQQAIRYGIDSLQRNLFQKRVNNFLYGVGGFLIAGISYKVILEYALIFKFSYLFISLPIILGILMWSTIGFVGWNEKREMRDLRRASRVLSENRDLDIKQELAHKNKLRDEIKALKRQIPTYPSDSCVRDWLNEDFLKLYKRSVEITALDNRLVEIESGDLNEKGRPLFYPNPIYVIGPGELQHPDKIPLTFSKKIRPDVNKHLFAKRSFYIVNENRFEVMYGVYYLEHILIADDMLATYGLFYDFITGKYHAEQITEQYYQDVVAITTTHEFREIPSSAEDQESRYVEDAPTFTLSLSSGEHRTVTFVSKKYFMEIRNKININEDDVSKISWIGISQMDADLAGRALRSQLRLHKLVVKEDEEANYQSNLIR